MRISGVISLQQQTRGGNLWFQLEAKPLISWAPRGGKKILRVTDLVLFPPPTTSLPPPNNGGPKLQENALQTVWEIGKSVFIYLFEKDNGLHA